MAEHSALVDEADGVRHELTVGNASGAMVALTGLIENLDRHVRREEDGILRAMRESGEFVDEVDALESEHRNFAATIAALDVDAPDFAATVRGLLEELDVHVEREDLGIFPVSAVTLGARGWEIVHEAHTQFPSFLVDHEERPVV